jgi:hypothetical protein
VDKRSLSPASSGGPVEGDGELLFDGLVGQRLVIRDGQPVLAQAFQIAADGVLTALAGFVEGVAFGDQARQRRARDHIPSFFSQLKKHGVVVAGVLSHVVGEFGFSVAGPQDPSRDQRQR